MKITDVRQRLGMRIRTLREERGLTQDDLADRIRISRVYVWQLERGERTASLETLIAIAKAFDVSLSEIFLDVDRETSKELTRLSAAAAGQPIGIQRRIFRVVQEMLGVVREVKR